MFLSLCSLLFPEPSCLSSGHTDLVSFGILSLVTRPYKNSRLTEFTNSTILMLSLLLDPRRKRRWMYLPGTGRVNIKTEEYNISVLEFTHVSQGKKKPGISMNLIKICIVHTFWTLSRYLKFGQKLVNNHVYVYESLKNVMLNSNIYNYVIRMGIVIIPQLEKIF